MATDAIKIPFTEAAAPSTPSAGKVVIYAKTNGLMYSKDDAGTETLMSAGGSSPTFHGCLLYATTGQTINTTNADLTFDGEEYDTDGLHAGSAAAITIPSGLDGYWRFTGRTQFSAGGGDWISFYKNGAALRGAYTGVSVFTGGTSGTGYTAVLTRVVAMVATNTLTLRAATTANVSVGNSGADGQSILMGEFLGV